MLGIIMYRTIFFPMGKKWPCPQNGPKMLLDQVKFHRSRHATKNIWAGSFPFTITDCG
jgi:hypothetical protein